MRKLTPTLVASLALASLAGAQKGAPGVLMEETYSSGSATIPSQTVNYVPANVISTSTFGGTSTLVLDIAGSDSWDALGDPSNTVLVVPLTTGDMMTGIGWDVTLTTVGGSWLSEARFYFDGSDQDLSGLFLTPGAGNSFPGTSVFFSSGGIIDLTDNGIPDIPVLADGNLYIELHESFDDAGDAVDATWIAPSELTIALDTAAGVPTVTQWGLIALTGLLLVGGAFVVSRHLSAKTAS